MNYTVRWLRVAEAQLAAIWIRASNKGAIAGYSEQIERALGRDPHEFGESRNTNTRIAFFRPLCVRYQIDDVARIVQVLGIRWVGL